MCKTYDVINSKIMELLEAGTVPWRKPWNAQSKMPKNIVSMKGYRGINTFLLGCSPYGSPFWMTFKQCQDKGGHVVKGAKSTPVVFFQWLDRRDDGSVGGEANIRNKIPMLRYYNVFNFEQVEGVKAPDVTETVNVFTPIEKAEQIIAGMPLRPDIQHGGNAASYTPGLDYVKLPVPDTFQSPEEFYSTAFHELTHATGHAKRLGRKGILEPSYFGSHEYSKEELVAEMGACFLCGHAGIEQKIIENSAAYIKGWLKALKDDKTLLVQAAGQAQKASDFILNITHQEDTTE